MATTGLQLLGFILGVFAWAGMIATCASPEWRKNSVGGTALDQHKRYFFYENSGFWIHKCMLIIAAHLEEHSKISRLIVSTQVDFLVFLRFELVFKLYVGICVGVKITFISYHRFDGLWVQCEQMPNGNTNCESYNVFFIGLPGMIFKHIIPPLKWIQK